MPVVDPVADLRRRFGRRHWEPVTWGRSGARVYRGDGVHVKIADRRHVDHPDPGTRLDTERLALEWLAGVGMPAPEVTAYGADAEREWLVTTTVPGRTVAEDWPAHQRTAVLRTMARFAGRLHSVPVTGCPLDRRLAVRREHLRRSVAAGLALTDPDPERSGWSVDRLVAETRRTWPDTEDLVVCHGDYCVPNVLLDPDSLVVTGVLDVGRLGVADRYTDLALATRSLGNRGLNPQYAPTGAATFLAEYGPDADPTDPRLDFYRLLEEFS